MAFAIATWVALAGLGLLVVFQLLLALGLPLGHLAWGGQHRRLPRTLRLASLVAAALLVGAVLCVLERAAVAHAIGSDAVARGGVWGFAALFALSTVGNLASKSDLERRTGTPLALILTVALVVIALQG